MDMDLCVRCGNCSLACHKMHGQSRLLRRGIQIKRPVSIGKQRLQHALLPQVCMHCKDPECLTGCPTGSIFRDPLGHVDIDPHTCIGCFDCATQCPVRRDYDGAAASSEPPTFSFVQTLTRALSVRSAEISSLTESDDVVAIKCNLCEDTPLESQRRATSERIHAKKTVQQARWFRVNPIEYFTEIGSTQGFDLPETRRMLFGRNIHKSDPLARVWNIAGALLSIAAAVITIFGLAKYGFDGQVGWYLAHDALADRVGRSVWCCRGHDLSASETGLPSGASVRCGIGCLAHIYFWGS